MKIAGIDIGSRTIEFVILDNNILHYSNQCETSCNPLKQIKLLLKNNSYDFLIATGYGRNLVQKNFECLTVTEIKAYARAVKEFYPETKVVLDIGGQDTKAILLDNNGMVKKFEMNDKCAAGTGKFLEIMALTLGVSIENFGALALESNLDLTINNTCTVFAESEVVSLLTDGYSTAQIAHAVHKSAALRAASMINRIAGTESEIIFAGGVAFNPAIVKLLKELTKKQIIIPEKPQFMGAIGAALTYDRGIE